MPLEVNEKLVENILLCDPITFRGREKLQELGLEDTITESVFFSEDIDSRLCIPPVDLDTHLEREVLPSELIIRLAENYSNARIATRRNALNSYFEGKQGDPVTVIKGVVGSGKSVELHRQIFEKYSRPPFQSLGCQDATPNAILIDLEEDVQSVFSEREFVNPEPDQPIWLFCTAALDTLLNYIAFLGNNYPNLLKTVSTNYERYFFSLSNFNVRTGNRFEYELFKDISQWANDLLPDKWDQIRQKIVDRLQSSQKGIVRRGTLSHSIGAADVKTILWLLFLVAFCSSPDAPKVIIIDNIEDYIATRTPDEELHRACNEGHLVSEEEIKLIYDCLYQTKNKVDRALRTYKQFVDKKFTRSASIVLAVRRTTYSLLSKWFMGTAACHVNGIFDITGDLSIEALWRRKYDTIWRRYLLPRCTTENNKDAIRYIDFVNTIITEGDDAKGRSYPQRLMPMLSRGLRRTGHNMSVNLFHVFEDLADKKKTHKGIYLSLTQFKKIFKEREAARFMLRQGLIEYYYMDQFTRTLKLDDPVGKRWRLLNIGHLCPAVEDQYIGADGEKTKISFAHNLVRYEDGRSDSDAFANVRDYNRVLTLRSLLWRILGLLSDRQNIGVSECIAPEYVELRIGDLLRRLFPEKPNMQTVQQLAKVVVGANLPEREGDYSPYALLQLQISQSTELFNESFSFADILSEMWNSFSIHAEAGKNDTPMEMDNKIRINEGGCDFLLQWQASYPFFSALYCYNFAPLFFVTSKDLIIHILQTVLKNAAVQREWYRKEARSFYNKINSEEMTAAKKLPDKYLLKIGNDYVSYDAHLRKLHKDYLALYKRYIEQCYLKMGFSLKDKDEILQIIDNCVASYNGEDWSRQVICF